MTTYTDILRAHSIRLAPDTDSQGEVATRAIRCADARTIVAALDAAGVQASWAPDHDDDAMAWVYVTRPTGRMSTYTIRTDADLCTMDADSMDAAAAAWARSEGYLGIDTVDDLLRRIARIDGAWIWIDSDGDEPRRGGSTPDALAADLR